MSDETLDRVRGALPDGWRASRDWLGRVHLERELPSETIEATICTVGRWWGIGATDRPPVSWMVERDYGGTGYKGRGWLERMVRDATAAAERSAGVREGAQE